MDSRVTGRPLRVLFVFSVEKAGGGAAAVWFNLLDGLRERGVAAHVVVPSGGDGSVKLALAQRGIPFTELFYTWWVTRDAHPHSLKRRLARRGARLANMRAERVVARIIERERIDVVYLCDGTITAGLAAARAAGVPVLWHFHQFIRGAEDGISFIEPDAVVARTLLQADRILTVTHGQRDELVGRFGVGPGRVEAVYNGVPPNAAPPVPAGVCGPLRRFALIGRIDANKRPLDALRAFELVAPAHPQARLLVVGSGSAACEDELRRAHAASPQRDAVELMAHQADLRAVWGRTDVALNCSMSEGCSMVVAQAMASGRLVIASSAAGNAELLDPQPRGAGLPAGARGLLYKRGDVADLAAQMAWTLEHEQAARGLAASGQRFAREAFSLERQVGRVHAVLAELAGRQTGRRSA